MPSFPLTTPPLLFGHAVVVIIILMAGRGDKVNENRKFVVLTLKVCNWYRNFYFKFDKAKFIMVVSHEWWRMDLKANNMNQIKKKIYSIQFRLMKAFPSLHLHENTSVTISRDRCERNMCCVSTRDMKNLLSMLLIISRT